MYLLENLNEPQKRAVCYDRGPLLVLAGPGSGKTRVITHRIAYLISRGVAPDRILALTFTNKAAEEMAARVEKLVHQKGVWISTFHSFCARILRREASLLGYGHDFTIYDTEDQKSALKQVLAALSIEPISDADDFLYAISGYKNKCITPEQILPSNYMAKATIKVYQAYQEFLHRNNAFDFDDLLLKTLEIFDHYKHVLEHYQDKFLYILIDEFQDTNLPQYQIAQKLAQKWRNVCGTGDPDQSIYSWRGANIQNILKFEKDFPDTLVVKLEQNYRSTPDILRAADAVISNNRLRKEKTLWTENPSGSPVRMIEAFDDYQQADGVCDDILHWKRQGLDLKEVAILYRMNAQSRLLEMALRNNHIAYRIVGGVEFYQRCEIKDIVAYLRAIANESDNLSLMRIINVPPRSLGKTTCDRLIQMAAQKNVPVSRLIRDPGALSEFSPRVQKSLASFAAMIDKFKRQPTATISELVENLIQETGYLAYIQKKDLKKDEDREANLQEFIASVKEYEHQFPTSLLDHFLERISLFSSADREEKSPEGRVTLMTLHSAKGLEFPVVYIVGLSEGTLPHHRSYTQEQLEEERRLFFVGMTRAQTILTLSNSKLSYRKGSYETANEPSRFLREIPKESLMVVKSHKRRSV